MHLGPKWHQVGSHLYKGPVAAREMQQHSLLAPDLASASDEGEDEMEVTMLTASYDLADRRERAQVRPMLKSPSWDPWKLCGDAE